MRRSSRVLISGDRHYTGWFRMENVFDEIAMHTEGHGLRTVIITGDATGADDIAGQLALKMGWLHIKFIADWERYGKSAGPIRNAKMLSVGNPEMVVAFHDDFPNSKGTRDMVYQSLKRGVCTHLVSNEKCYLVKGLPKPIYTAVDLLFPHDD